MHLEHMMRVARMNCCLPVALIPHPKVAGEGDGLLRELVERGGTLSGFGIRQLENEAPIAVIGERPAGDWRQ
jgi:hypothetical protein